MTAATPNSPDAPDARVTQLLWLSLLSGVCGIAYELLYARLLTTYLGDMFYVSAGILAVFLLGIGTGSFVARRFARWLWLVEALIGVYAIAAGLLFRAMGGDMLEVLTPLTAGSPAAVVGVVMALLGVPAVLVGFSVPLFALRLTDAIAATKANATAKEAAFSGFSQTYIRYNVGAGLAVLALEYSVLRSMGITGALFAVASLNMLVSAALFASGDAKFAPQVQPTPHRDTDRPALAALFAVSAASGIFQLFVLKLVETFLGPYHENFALVLALGLMGISGGALLVARSDRDFSTFLVGGAAAIACSLALMAVWIPAWGYINGVVAVGLGLPILAKLIILSLIAATGYVVFGATVPALLADERFAHIDAGRALAVSSFGNCVGYLATALVLHAALSSLGIAVVIAVTTGACGVLVAHESGDSGVPGLRVATLRRRFGGRLAGSLVCLTLLIAAWPAHLLTHSYRDLISPTALRDARGRMKAVQIHKKFDSHVAILEAPDGTKTLHINGYRSMVVRGDGVPNLHELLYGITPAVFARKHGHALVLGLGTGLTAAGTAPLFEKTDVVEIDPAIVDLLSTFAEANYHLAERTGVSVLLEDGLAALAASTQKYDAIVNTVTTPLYFSSSKLYAREFLQLVRKRLAPGGVYAMWFDQRVTGEGARTIFRTVADVFESCTVMMLKTGYFQLICGMQPTRADASVLAKLPAPIRKVLENGAGGMKVEALIKSLAFADHGLSTQQWEAPLHTFDRPHLEFVMASRAFVEAEDARIHQVLKLNFDTSPLASGGRLTPEESIDRCLALASVATGVPAACLEAMANKHGGKIPKKYDKSLVDLALSGVIEPKGDIAAWTLGLANTRMNHGDFEGAEQIAEKLEKKAEKLKAATQLRVLAGAWVIRAAIQARSAGEVDVRTATMAFRHAPFDTTLRRAMALTMATQHQNGTALAHLQALHRGGGLNRGDLQLRRGLLTALPGAATATFGGQP